MKPKKIGIIIIVILFLQFIASFKFSLLNDDTEALHAGWLIKNGKIPYVDFFEHHHPFVYYLIAGLFLIKETIFLPKIFFFLIYLSNLFILWKIASILELNKKQKLIYIFLLISIQPFIWSHLFLRPDVLMAFFAFLALYLYLLSEKSTKILPISFFCGISLFLSFLAMQTAIFFIFSIFLLFLIDIFLKKGGFKKLVYLTLGFTTPLFLFYLTIYLKNLWQNYFFFNFTFNKYWSGNNPPFVLIFESLFPLIIRNPVIWVLLFVSLSYYLFLFIKNIKKDSFSDANNFKIKKIFFLIIIQIASFFYLIFGAKIMIAPYRFLIFLPLALFFVVLFLEKLERILPKVYLFLFFFIFIIIFANSLKWIIYSGHNNKIQNYILNNTSVNDKVLIFEPEYHPIFRQDATFCWFHQETCLKKVYAYNNHNNLEGIYKIILKEQPKAIYFPKNKIDLFFQNPLIKEIIEKEYKKTEFENLYFKK